VPAFQSEAYIIERSQLVERDRHVFEPEYNTAYRLVKIRVMNRFSMKIHTIADTTA
jgi:hypothetical protein